MSFLVLILSVLLRAIGLPIALLGVRYRKAAALASSSFVDSAVMLIRSSQLKIGQLTIQPVLVSGWPPALSVLGDYPKRARLRPLIERSLIRT